MIYPLIFATPIALPPAAAQTAFTHTVLPNGLQFRAGGVTKTITFFGPSIVRVNANLGQSFAKHPSLSVVARPEKIKLRVIDSQTKLTVISSALRVEVDKKSRAITFLRPDGQVITRENRERPTELKEVEITGQPTYNVRQTFSLSPDESLYGLGQYNRPYMDYRGQEVLLVQTNVGIVVPFLISTKRYGIMWDITSKSTFKDDATGASFWAESAPAGVDYYFVAGQDMDGVIRGYRKLTGDAPMFPKSAFGLFMSKERYATQDRLIEVVRNFRRDKFPLDNIVQDWQYWGGADGTWSGMIWDKTRYPDPKGLTRTLHNDLHVKLMNSIWPSIGDDTDLARELDAKGLRFAPLHWISKKAHIYDAFSPEGRAIYFKHIKKGLLDFGVDALWMDGTEVEVGGACHDAAEVERDIKGLGVNAMGDFTRYLNPYSLVTTQGTYEGQRATSNKRVLTLTRSAWTGQQRYAALPWSGDTTASWNTLRAQISGGINVAMAGLPYWTQDTGGFFVNYPGGEKNLEYQELYARWNQFAIFNPLYRIHGTNVEREPYIFRQSAPEIYDSLLTAANLRYQLLPYTYSLAWQSAANGYTMMRGSAMDFPDDPNVRKLDDQFMFGPAFLVHPITRPMYRVSAPPAATIPTEVLRTLDGQPGLAVQYYDGSEFERPVGNAIDAKVDHTWPGPPLASPPPGLTSLENFSARWEGTITAPEDGEYEIGAEFDDGVRLFLDGKLVFQDWAFAAKRYQGAKITLKKGQKLPLKAEYHQGRYDRVFRLTWRTPSDLRKFATTKQGVNNLLDTYLPKDADWFDFWTNQPLKGGQTVTKACALNTLPVYVRAGSIVPIGPKVQYATENPSAPYEIRIYPGADAKFTIYEDDNETYDYEKGRRATYDLTWEDATQTLTISPRQGTFPGLVSQRTLNISLINPGKPASNKSIQYVGKRVNLTF